MLKNRNLGMKFGQGYPERKLLRASYFYRTKILHLRVTALIPARYEATRFPRKLMQLLGGKPVIRHTYENAVATGLFEEVMVVTDSEVILNEIRSVGGRAVLSRKPHESGSDRIAEIAVDLDTDLILNVQGDEPFLSRDTLKAILDTFADPAVQVASAMKRIHHPEEVANPHIVKVTVDLNGRSLLFSRSPIPYPRDRDMTPDYFEHIGIYAFRKEALLQFTAWTPTPLELAEKIECLRYLEHGLPLQMVLTEQDGVKIDVPEDLVRAEAFLTTWKGV